MLIAKRAIILQQKQLRSFLAGVGADGDIRCRVRQRVSDRLGAVPHWPTTQSLWKFAFDEARSGELRIVQSVLLGINAHIHLDLPVVSGTMFGARGRVAGGQTDRLGGGQSGRAGRLTRAAHPTGERPPTPAPSSPHWTASQRRNAPVTARRSPGNADIEGWRDDDCQQDPQ
ncbi:MAG: DUF5995 family protein [Mycobacterium sp.]